MKEHRPGCHRIQRAYKTNICFCKAIELEAMALAFIADDKNPIVQELAAEVERLRTVLAG